MKSYFCEPIQKVVTLISINNHSSFKVFMASYDTGEFLFFITVDIFTGRKYCACVDNKTYPWLCDWLVENCICFPTKRTFLKDNFCYLEFKFNKEEF